MNNNTKEKLASSLTAETTELLPYLPFLLQDFWELGSEPGVIVKLIKKRVELSDTTQILDLACGKGAVSVKVAQKLQVHVKGIDLIPEFIDFAKQKAKEYGVNHLCEFMVGDINEMAKIERNYDCVIFGAAGDVMGGNAETLAKLKKTVKKGGHIIIDECYLSDNVKQSDVKYNKYKYLSKTQWCDLFKEAGLELVDTVLDVDSPENLDNVSGINAITTRANELIEQHPDKRIMFEDYVRSQRNEYEDIDTRLAGATWILKKL